jgi:hypothetical protein
LEPRTLLVAAGLFGNLQYLALLGRYEPGVGAMTTTNTSPTVAQPASLVTPGNVTGTSANVSVLGADAQGESSLIYTWKVTSAPQGGSATFNVNGSNAAKNDALTFSEAGVYGVSVAIVDGSGLSVSSSLQITVVPTLSSIGLYAVRMPSSIPARR